MLTTLLISLEGFAVMDSNNQPSILGFNRQWHARSCETLANLLGIDIKRLDDADYLKEENERINNILKAANFDNIKRNMDNPSFVMRLEGWIDHKFSINDQILREMCPTDWIVKLRRIWPEFDISKQLVYLFPSVRRYTRAIQRLANLFTPHKIEVDGVWGNMTNKALVYVQSSPLELEMKLAGALLEEYNQSQGHINRIGLLLSTSF